MRERPIQTGETMIKLTDTQLREGIAIAEAATPGSWTLGDVGIRDYMRLAPSNTLNDAIHISANDPATAIALRQELLEARRRIEELEDVVMAIHPDGADATALMNDAAKAVSVNVLEKELLKAQAEIERLQSSLKVARQAICEYNEDYERLKVWASDIVSIYGVKTPGRLAPKTTP